METLKKKRVLITGAAGRIGKILRTDLAALFDLTLVTDTPIDGLKCQILDVANDYQRLRQIIDGHQTVVHLAYLDENDTNTVNFKMAKNIFSVVSQMSPLVLDTTTVDIEASGKESYRFRAMRSVLKFPGFTILYSEGRDDAEEESEKAPLPALTEGEKVSP